MYKRLSAIAGSFFIYSFPRKTARLSNKGWISLPPAGETCSGMGFKTNGKKRETGAALSGAR
jgi:hypothetical protein